MASRDIRRKFGQNYLSDPAIIFEMSRAISPLDGDNFFEIGPGMGALTNVLNLPGINVKAIDVDNKNIEYLKKKYLAPAKFDFIHGDILSAPLDFLEKDKYRIVGNLPYNISTQIILMFSNWSHVVGDLHFLVQKEVAEKIAGQIASKNWGKLSIKLSAFFNTEILFDVPPEAFDIKPKVNSSFIRMTSQKKYNIDQHTKDNLYKIIDMSFSSRRKNIKNNLKKLDLNWDVFDINPSLRPEELSLDDYLKISKNLEN
ncbi:16S rRNA (adenine(1518)-N(6)/adenine(1519)-N(6))-dimethyltransferase RsmA [Gammaproteobacteria bacterium]|nr:16S rRNA (adenine(1518)-N(6)/adenine(1519)-N(6))-dimethyltransferase RsmA [Gammaproteobacteria bacterium]